MSAATRDDRNTCPDCGRQIAGADDWRRAEANDAAGGDPEAPWAVALCWGAGNNCEAVSARGRIAALEADVERLRRERDEARVALRRSLASIPLHMRELRVQVATAAGLM